jgi:hypothetical protein
MRTACVYHRSDLDGFCSAAIVREACPEIVELIPMEHGDPIPWDLLQEMERVYVVDFSLAPFEESMQRLKAIVPEVIWIDHHKTAIDAAQACNLDFPGKQACGKAACELCWEYFFDGAVAMPKPVWLLGRYDVWDLNADPRIEHFQLGMQAQEKANPLHPESEAFWTDVFFADSDFVDSRVYEGKSIMAHRQSTYRMYQQQAHTLRFEGANWVALNTQKTGSKVFEGIYNPELHRGCIAYFRSPSGKWVVSLYSLDNLHDLSVIAKKHGGGGHASACGFALESFQFDLFIRDGM